MAKFNEIVCLGFNGSELSPTLWKQLDNLTSKRSFISEANLSDGLSADCLLVKLGAKLDKEQINGLPNLLYVGMLGTGYGGLDTLWAAKRGVTVTNITDYATEAVAEFFFGVCLNQLRDLSTAKAQADSGNYSDDNFGTTEIKGLTFGIIGLGHIGQRIAELAIAFGANVIYWSRHRKTELESDKLKHVSLETLLKQSDVISLNLAYSPQTERIIDDAKFKFIKPGALLINLSPMELFDFDSLVKHLKSDKLSLILDHPDEMSAEQLKKLKPFKNCIIYPPGAYMTEPASQLKQAIYVNNLRSFLAGKPTNKVN